MKKAAAVLAVALTILLHSYVWISLRSSITNIEEENGVMENYQAIGLVICVALWIWCVSRSKVRAEKVFFASLALFSLSLLILEVDFRKMDAPVLNRIMNGRIRDIWLGALWVGAAILFFKNKQAVLKTFGSWIWSSAGLLMVLGGIFWVLAALIDKGLLGTKTLFGEELMEVNAALFMVTSAVLTVRGLVKRPGAVGTAATR